MQCLAMNNSKDLLLSRMFPMNCEIHWSNEMMKNIAENGMENLEIVLITYTISYTVENVFKHLHSNERRRMYMEPRIQRRIPTNTN